MTEHAHSSAGASAKADPSAPDGQPLPWDIDDGETPADPEIRFAGDLHDAHHGQRMFSIRDPNGYTLHFGQG